MEQVAKCEFLLISCFYFSFDNSFLFLFTPKGDFMMTVGKRLNSARSFPRFRWTLEIELDFSKLVVLKLLSLSIFTHKSLMFCYIDSFCYNSSTLTRLSGVSTFLLFLRRHIIQYCKILWVMGHRHQKFQSTILQWHNVSNIFDQSSTSCYCNLMWFLCWKGILTKNGLNTKRCSNHLNRV